MKPKKLKQEQFEIVKRSNEKHNLFTFDMTHPFYYVIDHVFSDPKKRMLVYFDEEESKLVWMEELSEKEGLNTPIVQKWIEDYHKKKKKDEKERSKAREEKKKEREVKKMENNKAAPKTNTKNKKKPGTKPKNTTKKDGTPRKKPGPKPKKSEDGESEKVA